MTSVNLGPTPTVNNHYVPEWYQRRFLSSGTSRFHYLDMQPDRIPGVPGKRRTALLHWGPGRCFARDHLYTVKLGRWLSDMVEHGFFKEIDDGGRKGVKHFAQYKLNPEFEEAWHGLMAFMDAQRFRTPRGLDHFAKLTRVDNRNALLLALQAIYRLNATMWTEGIWEIVSARNSATKFLLTDNPVTFYNERAFPGSPFCAYPGDAQLRWVGTRTVFPLDLETCLIITHREYTRNPWKNPLADRVNPRSYASTIFNAQEIQTQRELVEDEVLRINLILKRRADRYIAACNEEWLYPERAASETHWSKIDHDWFLMPNLYELHLGGTILVGYNDGRSAGWDEYGRPREHPDFERKQKDESRLHRNARLEWGARRIGKSIGLSERLLYKGRDRKPEWAGYMKEEVERYIADQRLQRRRDRDGARSSR